MIDYYKVLGIEHSAAQAKIRQAYREQIKKYHPDRNQNSPEATQRTQLIIEAYGILSDPVKRNEYDSTLRNKTSHSEQSAKTAESYDKAPPSQPLPKYCCKSCGRQDPSLRLSVFSWVISILVMTYKNGEAEILCSKCRILHSLMYNIEVLLFGWWGFPWGPIYSFEALGKNSRGGHQPVDSNAMLLRTLGYDLFLQGRVAEACEAIRNSLKFAYDKKTDEFLSYLGNQLHSAQGTSIYRKIVRLHPAYFNIPLLVVFFALVIYIIAISGSNRSSGYESRYQGAQSIGQTPQTSSIEKSAIKAGIDLTVMYNAVDQCNKGIENIAQYIHRTVPLIATTHEANRTIYHYALDRSKIRIDSISVSSSAIFAAFKSAEVFIMNNDLARKLNAMDSLTKIDIKRHLNTKMDFLAAAAFNARILEISISSIHNFETDGNISPNDISQMAEVLSNQYISKWLTRIGFMPNVDGLMLTLKKYTEISSALAKAKSTLRQRKMNIDALADSISNLEEKLNFYESANLHDDYNNLLNEYNSMILRHKKLVTKYNPLADGYNELNERFNKYARNVDLDSCFNVCLDPAIFFSVFESVDLTHSVESHN